MLFQKQDAWAVRQALDEMYAAGVPSSHYNQACLSLCKYNNGALQVSESVAGMQLILRTLEILEEDKPDG